MHLKFVQATKYFFGLPKIFIGLSIIQFAHSWKLSLLGGFLSSGEENLYYTRDLQEIQKEYLDQERLKLKYLEIDNLENYLDQLSAESSCFVVLENFQYINMNHTKTPIILRTQVPFVQTYFQFKWKDNPTWRIMLGPSISRFQNFSVNQELENLTCSISKYLIGLDSETSDEPAYHNLCMMINLGEYFMHAKAPNCYAHLGIFPPQYVDTHKWYFIFPNIFGLNIGKTSKYIWTHNSVYLINILLLLQRDIRDRADENMRIRKWISGPPSKPQYSIRQDIFAVGEISFANTPDALTQSIGYIISTTIFKICYSCKEGHSSKDDNHGTLIRMTTDTFNYTTATILGFPTSEESIAWKITSVLSKNQLAGTMLSYAETCHSNTFNSLWQGILSETSLLGKVGIAHSDVLKSVMKNYTLPDYDSVGDCYLQGLPEFFIYVTPSFYVRSLLSLPHYTSDVLSGMRFIGCERKGLSVLPFQEFVNVFDLATWMGIIATILGASVSLRLLLLNTSVSENLMAVLKVVLEQGDPFHNLLPTK